jgi:hypothetical protein
MGGENPNQESEQQRRDRLRAQLEEFRKQKPGRF